MDGVSQPTPESGLPPQPAPGESPAPQQAPPTEQPLAAASTPRPVNVEALQAGLTQHSQRNAALVRALGLPKTATTEEQLAYIEELKQKAAYQQAVAANGYELSPELAAQQKALEDRAWAAAARDFGQEVAQQARHIAEIVYNSGDGYELTQAVRELGTLLQAQGQAAAPSAPAEQAPPQQSQERPGVDMEMGQPGWIAQPDADDKPGSGDTEGFFRRAFARAR